MLRIARGAKKIDANSFLSLRARIPCDFLYNTDPKQRRGAGHDDQTQRDSEAGPLGARDVQRVRGDDVGDIARNEHAAGDQQAEQRVFDLRDTERRLAFGCGESRVIEDGRDHVYPKENLRWQLETVGIDERFKTGAEEDQRHDEKINFTGPNENLAELFFFFLRGQGATVRS